MLAVPEHYSPFSTNHSAKVAALIDTTPHTSSDEDEVRRASRRRRQKPASRHPMSFTDSELLAAPTVPDKRTPASSYSTTSTASSGDALYGEKLVGNNWIEAMDVPAAWQTVQETPHTETASAAAHSSPRAAKAPLLHVRTDEAFVTTPPRKASVVSALLTSPTSVSSTNCLSPKPTRPALVYQSGSQSSLSTIGSAGSTSSPPSPLRRESIDLVDVFEGEVGISLPWNFPIRTTHTASNSTVLRRNFTSWLGTTSGLYLRSRIPSRHQKNRAFRTPGLKRKTRNAEPHPLPGKALPLPSKGTRCCLAQRNILRRRRRGHVRSI